MAPNIDHDGPSDEEASASLSASSSLAKQQHQRTQYVASPDPDTAGSPPPPPPSAPPPPAAAAAAGTKQKPSPRFPPTKGSGKNHEGTVIEIKSSSPTKAINKTADRSDSLTNHHYESFPIHRRMPSNLTSDGSQPEDEINRITKAKLLKSKGERHKLKNQVLVHYHPQLGDEGYESTLLDESGAAGGAVALQQRSRRNRNRGRSEPFSKNEMPYPTVISTTIKTSPRKQLKHRISDNAMHMPSNTGGVGGMNSRMIDDVRESKNIDGSSLDVGYNDEDNNAATRQIRRRVFRVAMEQGSSLDERRKKLLSADEDVGGPSLRVNSVGSGGVGSGIGNKNEGGYSVASSINTKVSIEKAPQRLTISTYSATDDMDIPLPTPTTTTSRGRDTPKSQMSVRSTPPPPPTTAPSYRLIVESLIGANEPEKLSQIDRVMEKYEGREEELIKKLDLRYRKRKARKEMFQSQVEKIVVQQEEESKMKDNTAVLSDNRDGGNEDENETMQLKGIESKPSDDSNPPPPPADDAPIAISVQKQSTTTITSSTRTALHSNTMDMEEEEGMIPSIPKQRVVNEDDFPMQTSATAEFVSPLRFDNGENGDTPNAALVAPLSPTYHDDNISLITMETKETLYGKRGGHQPGEGEAAFSYAEMMRRPPDSIILDSSNSAGGSGGGGGTVAQTGNVNAKPPLSPEKMTKPASKINRLLPNYEKDTEDEKAKAAEASLEASAKLDNVEARILARHKLREDEAKGVDDGIETVKSIVFDEEESLAKMKSSTEDQVGVVLPEDKKESATVTSMAFEEEESFVGKMKTQFQQHGEIENRESLLDDEAHLGCDQAEKDINGTEEEKQSCLANEIAVGGVAKLDVAETTPDEDDDVSRREAALQLKTLEEEIARLVAEKESRFAAEKAVALKKAEEALENERNARLKAESELRALKESKEEAMPESRAMDTNSGVTQAIATKPSGDDSSISMSMRSSPMHEGEETHSYDSENNPEKKDDDSVDIVEKMRAVWSSDEEESQHDRGASDEDSDVENEDNNVHAANQVMADDDDDDDSDDNNSYLPSSLQSSPERGIRLSPAKPPVDDYPLPTMPLEPVHIAPLLPDAEKSVPVVGVPADTAEEQQTKDELTEERPAEVDNTPNETDQQEVVQPKSKEPEDQEANIHHVAKFTFEGDPSKCQLSFTAGAVVLAHSNQRGPLWLGISGGRTGWFPASSVVPASEFLGNRLHTNEPQIEEEEKEFAQMSQPDIDKTYDLIRSPSDPGDSDGDSKSSDDVPNDKAAKVEPEPQTTHEPQMNVKKTKIKRIWRDVKDPNSGLTYYYNVETRVVSLVESLFRISYTSFINS